MKFTLDVLETLETMSKTDECVTFNNPLFKYSNKKLPPKDIINNTGQPPIILYGDLAYDKCKECELPRYKHGPKTHIHTSDI